MRLFGKEITISDEKGPKEGSAEEGKSMTAEEAAKKEKRKKTVIMVLKGMAITLLSVLAGLIGWKSRGLVDGIKKELERPSEPAVWDAAVDVIEDTAEAAADFAEEAMEQASEMAVEEVSTAVDEMYHQ